VKTDINGFASISLPLNTKVKVSLPAAGIANVIIDTVPVMNLLDYV
jgi:hypothetical protein